MSKALGAACTWKRVGRESSSALGEGVGWRYDVCVCACVCVGGVCSATHSVNLLHKSQGGQRGEAKHIGRGAAGKESSDFGSE